MTFGKLVLSAPRRALAATGVALLAGLAQAQTAAPAGAESADEILRIASAVVERIDAGKLGLLWQGVPAFVRERLTETAFVQSIAQERAPLGSVRQRIWMSVERLPLTTADGAPPLLCANVGYIAHLPDGRSARERVSLCRGPSGWQPTGYNAALVAPPAQAPAAPAQR